MKRQFWGLVLTLVGILALLQVMGVRYLGLTFWPVVFAVVGLSILWSSFRRFSVFGLALGLWLGAIGVFDILVNAGVNTAGITGGRIAASGWPLLLVAIGVSMFVGRRSFRWVISTDWDDWRNRRGSDATRIIGDTRVGQGGPWQLDKDINIDHGIGDIKVDLTTAEITAGVHVVRIHAGIGDVVIRVPDDVSVSASGKLGIGDLNVLGDRRSGFGCKAYRSVTVPDSAIELQIDAHAGIGNLEIVQRPASTMRVVK